jgi:hypothetical protein
LKGLNLRFRPQAVDNPVDIGKVPRGRKRD